VDETQLSMLQKASNRIMRIILHCVYKNRTYAVGIVKKLVMSVKQRLYYNVYIFI